MSDADAEQAEKCIAIALKAIDAKDWAKVSTSWF